MHIDWVTLLLRFCAYLYANRLAISMAAFGAGSAAVKTMPALIPRTLQDWWTWFSEWAHAMFNTKIDRQEQLPGKQ